MRYSSPLVLSLLVAVSAVGLARPQSAEAQMLDASLLDSLSSSRFHGLFELFHRVLFQLPDAFGGDAEAIGKTDVELRDAGREDRLTATALVRIVEPSPDA